MKKNSWIQDQEKYQDQEKHQDWEQECYMTTNMLSINTENQYLEWKQSRKIGIETKI